MIMKKDIQKGLAGLMTPPTQAKAPAQTTVNTPSQAPKKTPSTQAEKTTGNYRTACYSLPNEVVDKVAEIAYLDRKKKSAVLAEAVELYAAQWEKNRN